MPNVQRGICVLEQKRAKTVDVEASFATDRFNFGLSDVPTAEPSHASETFDDRDALLPEEAEPPMNNPLRSHANGLELKSAAIASISLRFAGP